MGRFGKGHAPHYLGDFSGGEPYPDITPVALPATNINYYSFTANWEAFPGAVSYILQVSVDPVFESLVSGLERVVLSGVLSVDLVVSLDNQNYYYRIQVVTDTLTTMWSNEIELKTLDYISHTLVVSDTLHLFGSDNVLFEESSDTLLNVDETLHLQNVEEPVLVLKTIKNGLLYNYHVIQDLRGFAPEGWHVIRFADWLNMIQTVDPTYSLETGGAGTAMFEFKDTDQAYWFTDFGNTNSLGFNARGNGMRVASDGSFGFIQQIAAMWTLDRILVGVEYWCGTMIMEDGNLYPNLMQTFNNADKCFGFAIRWVKDDSNDPGAVTGNDGQIYPTIKIGNVVTTAFNIAETKYRKTMSEVWGALYNYYAVTNAKNIANTGWHVPSDIEISLISAYNGAYGLDWKVSGLDYWNSPNSVTNGSSLINIRGAGYRSQTGVFVYKKYNGYIATSQISSPGYWKAYVCLNSNASIASSGSTALNHGISVRLVKDSTSLTHGQTGTYTGNDGKIYPTVCIGTKEILAVNLNETKFRDGSDIPLITDDGEWGADTEGAMCYYNNDNSNIIPEVTENSDWIALASGALCAYNNDHENV